MLLIESCPSPQVTNVLSNDGEGRLLIDDLVKPFISVVGIAAVAEYFQFMWEATQKTLAYQGNSAELVLANQVRYTHSSPNIIPAPSTRRPQ